MRLYSARATISMDDEQMGGSKSRNFPKSIPATQMSPISLHRPREILNLVSILILLLFLFVGRVALRMTFLQMSSCGTYVWCGDAEMRQY